MAALEISVPATALARSLRSGALIIAGTILLAVSAKLQVPLPPVPMTMQTFVVLVMGAVYGPRLGSATMLAYLAEGLAGIPVFAAPTAGPAYMAGPTAGYLAGFVASVAFVGLAARRGWCGRLVPLAATLGFGHLMILAFGVGWLSHLVGWEKAVLTGFVPFAWATLVKTVLAVAAVRGLHRILPSSHPAGEQ